MTTTPTAPSLPLTLADLNALLPAAPADTAVAHLLDAIDCIDKAVRAQVAELELLEQIDRRDVAALVEAAGTGDMTKALGTIKQSNRAVVELRLDMLRRARVALVGQYDDAERNDPDHVAWVQRCRELTDEWSRAMAIDDEGARFANLINFVARLG
jgi:hypothetical protein